MTGSEKLDSPDIKPFRVLVLGGSYGGLAAALDLLDLCAGRKSRSGTEPAVGREIPIDITIVDERDGFFHLIGAPLALIEPTYASQSWVKYTDIPALNHPNVHLLQASVKAVDPEKMRASVLPHDKDNVVMEHDYDYLIAATGFRRVWPTVPQAVDREHYLDEANGHIDLVKHAEHGVVVVGGGAVGIEMAAETKMVCPETKVTLIHSRDHLLSSEPLPEEFAVETLKLLRGNNVDVILGKRVLEVSSDEKKKLLKLSDGTTISASHVISAISKPISTARYLPKEALDEEKQVRVKATLQFADVVPNPHCHLAVGDIAAWPPNPTPVIKRCGGAMYHGNIAACNLYQHMLQRLGYVEKPIYQEVAVHDPAIALALSNTAVGYSSQTGIASGPEVRERMFGNDLALTICWKYLGLSTKPGSKAIVAV